MKAYYTGAARQRALSFRSIGSWGGSGLCALLGGLVDATMDYLVAILVAIRVGEKLQQRCGGPRRPMLLGSAAIFTALSVTDSLSPMRAVAASQTGQLRFAAAVALWFNVAMVLLAALAIKLGMPKQGNEQGNERD